MSIINAINQVHQISVPIIEAPHTTVTSGSNNSESFSSVLQNLINEKPTNGNSSGVTVTTSTQSSSGPLGGNGQSTTVDVVNEKSKYHEVPVLGPGESVIAGPVLGDGLVGIGVTRVGVVGVSNEPVVGLPGNTEVHKPTPGIQAVGLDPKTGFIW
jgi:hypothetical protein